MKKKYIRFKLLEEKPKTHVYAVMNIKSRDALGYIKWYPAWRQYCFFTEEIGAVFNTDCLTDIRDFIQDLMDERMIKKHEKD